MGLLGNYCTSASLEGTKDKACEMSSAEEEEVQALMKRLAGEGETRGGSVPVPGPRSKTVEKTKGKTKTIDRSRSISLHAEAARLWQAPQGVAERDPAGQIHGREAKIVSLNVLVSLDGSSGLFFFSLSRLCNGCGGC